MPTPETDPSAPSSVSGSDDAAPIEPVGQLQATYEAGSDEFQVLISYGTDGRVTTRTEFDESHGQLTDVGFVALSSGGCEYRTPLLSIPKKLTPGRTWTSRTSSECEGATSSIELEGEVVSLGRWTGADDLTLRAVVLDLVLTTELSLDDQPLNTFTSRSELRQTWAIDLLIELDSSGETSTQDSQQVDFGDGPEPLATELNNEFSSRLIGLERA